jgi:hypothetical protein
MAIYHLHAQVISRSAGRSAVAASAYRAGVRLVSDRDGLIHDYTRKSGIDHSAMLAPEGAPAWALDRAQLWDRVEAAETRRDAQLCREIDIALPVELSNEAKRELITDWVQRELVALGMVAQIDGHHWNSDNPHAHVMLTMRPLDGDAFGKKAREWNRPEVLEHLRQSWAEAANAALTAAGQDARIDHRTLAAQGIQREPSPHLGPKASGYEARTGLPSNVRLLREAANAPRAAFDAVAIQAAEADVIELEAQLDALQREQRQQQRQAAQLDRYLAHEAALAGLPLVPTSDELAQHLRDWPEPKLRQMTLEQVRQGPLSIPTTDERREAARLQQVQREQERERSTLRASVKALCAERDQRQRRPWILRLFDHRLPQVLQQIEAVERRWDALRAERRATHAAVLKAQSAAEAADNAARASALAALEAVIERAVQSADAPLPSDSPPQELARAAPAPATPEQPRLRRPR